MIQLKNLFVLGKEIDPGHYKIIEAYTSQSGIDDRLQERINNDPSGSYVSIFPDSWSYTASFAADTINYMDVKNNTFEKITTFDFPGTNLGTTPSVFSAIGYNTVPDVGNIATIRIFDITNSIEIASVSIEQASTTKVVSILLSNLPATAAIFELQGKIVGGGTFYLESVNMR